MASLNTTVGTVTSGFLQGRSTSGVLYIGHIPHGFYEDQMRGFFGQFGTIKRLRLSRNKKTGKSKHYAFIEFETPEVAQIVAEAMHNYLLFESMLQVKLVPLEKIHSRLYVLT
jgi:nucleolar protein 15